MLSVIIKTETNYQLNELFYSKEITLRLSLKFGHEIEIQLERLIFNQKLVWCVAK